MLVGNKRVWEVSSRPYVRRSAGLEFPRKTAIQRFRVSSIDCDGIPKVPTLESVRMHPYSKAGGLGVTSINDLV